MRHDTGKHCVLCHRYHFVWSPKYRYKVVRGDLRLRVRDICRQVCRENEVEILRGVLSSDHVHMFVSVPPVNRHPMLTPYRRAKMTPPVLSWPGAA